MTQLWQDLRYAFRTLSKSPGFLLVAVLSLAVGIGANTAIFAVVDAVMLRALPVANPERLALLTTRAPPAYRWRPRSAANSVFFPILYFNACAHTIRSFRECSPP